MFLYLYVVGVVGWTVGNLVTSAIAYAVFKEDQQPKPMTAVVKAFCKYQARILIWPIVVLAFIPYKLWKENK